MWNRGKKDRELEEEIRTHFAIEVQQRIERGESREEAERGARREFGNVALVTEVTRNMWAFNWVESIAQDLKYAFRTMRKAPGFTASAILTFGLGVAASTAVFSVVNGVLLRPLPYKDPNQIAVLWRLAPLSDLFGAQYYPWGKADFSLYRDQTKVFESVGAFQADTFNLTGLGEPIFLEGMRASAGFFPSLGVRPQMGRFFSNEEDRKGQEHVVVLGDRLWRDRFGGDQNILGRAIELNGFAYTVVGVMPPGFSFPHAEEMPAVLEFPREAQLWVPAAIPPDQRGPSELAVVGRMRPGATLPQAQAELDVFADTLARAFPASKNWTKSRAVALEKQIVGDTRQPLLLLLAAVAVVLLIACSNVAGLVLTRSLKREREFMLRSALGAGLGRLTRQLITENLLLAGAGGLLGLMLAQAFVSFVTRYGPASLPRLSEVALDPAAFAFCAGITLVTGLLFGLAPRFVSAGQSLADSLKSGPRIAGGHFSPNLRNFLLIGQVALALLLVVAAGLLIRTFNGLLHTDRGFDYEHVLTFEISLPPSTYPDHDHMAKLYAKALHALRAVPGVEAAGLVHAVPMGGAPDSTGIRVPGRTLKPNERPYANYMFSSPGYFSATHTPLLEGREFSDSDTLDAPHVTIVNRAMAEALWPGENAIGKQVGVGLTTYAARIVVGVVANVKQSSLREETPPQMYVPYSQSEIPFWPPMQTMQVALRTAADPATMTASVREAMRTVDPALPLARVATLKTLVSESLTQPRFAMLMLIAFGVLALILASVGMYGVISHSVAQRTQEIGIRMALGAGRTTVFRMVLGQGARLAGAGIGIGVVAALIAMRATSSFLYGVRPSDPLTFVVVSVLLAAVALIACYLPARRATSVDPIVALRSE